MEEKMRQFFTIYKKYPTYKDFCKSTILPDYSKFRNKYKNYEMNEAMSIVYGTPTYKEILLKYLNGRELVYFKVKDVVSEPYIPKQSFARWLGNTKLKEYDLSLYRSRSNNNGGVYCARKR